MMLDPALLRKLTIPHSFGLWIPTFWDANNLNLLGSFQMLSNNFRAVYKISHKAVHSYIYSFPKSIVFYGV